MNSSGPKTCKNCGGKHLKRFDLCDKCAKEQKLLKERTFYHNLRKERLATGFCVKCGINKFFPPLTRCDSCRTKRVSYKKEKRIRYIAEGKCNNCGSPASVACKELCEACNQIKLDGAREIARKNKVIVMAHYGQSACNCCGEKTLEFLTIDHIDGGGSHHRRALFNSRDKCGEKFYRWLIKNNLPPGYQVLCFSCNYGKYVNGICPHRAPVKVPITYSQRRGLEIKIQVMQAYGSKCACCPETLLPLLNIDHINGRTDRMRGGHLYRWLIKNNYPKEFQILCLNCNISKYLSGTCVHSASLV
jgi:uncharacterized OB-fold protein